MMVTKIVIPEMKVFDDFYPRLSDTEQYRFSGRRTIDSFLSQLLVRAFKLLAGQERREE